MTGVVVLVSGTCIDLSVLFLSWCMVQVAITKTCTCGDVAQVSQVSGAFGGAKSDHGEGVQVEDLKLPNGDQSNGHVGEDLL